MHQTLKRVLNDGAYRLHAERNARRRGGHAGIGILQKRLLVRAGHGATLAHTEPRAI